MKEIYKETYLQEAEEHLASIEEAILDIEDNPDDKESINRLFRAIHTIKGSGAMFGFDDIAGFAHHLETVLEKVRKGILPVTSQLIDLVLASRDQIKIMLDATHGGAEADIELSGKIIGALEYLLSEAENVGDSDLKSVSSLKNSKKDEMTCRIRFHPKPDIFESGTEPALLLEELRNFGEYNIVAHTHKIPQLKDINPELCYIHWNIILTTCKELDMIKDVFIFVEDRCDLKIDLIDTQFTTNNVESHKRVGEILIDRGDLSSDELIKALNIQKRVGEILIENRAIDQDAVDAALIEQEHVRQIRKKRREAVSSSSIRVAADKLDNLINLVGELVITQARLTQVSSDIDNIELANPVEEIERLTVELRDCALNMRMVPIGTTFGKFRRLVRDLSAELGKEINLVTEGGRLSWIKPLSNVSAIPLFI